MAEGEEEGATSTSTESSRLIDSSKPSYAEAGSGAEGLTDQSAPSTAQSKGASDGGLEAPAPACEARTGECVSGLGEACKAHLRRGDGPIVERIFEKRL